MDCGYLIRTRTLRNTTTHGCAGLFESIMPLVKTQVDSQIKVRDLSNMSVAVSPAEYNSWSDARAQLIVEKKRPLKAMLQSELAKADTEAAADEVRAVFASRESALEHEMDHTPLHLNLEIGGAHTEKLEWAANPLPCALWERPPFESCLFSIASFIQLSELKSTSVRVPHRVCCCQNHHCHHCHHCT